MHHIRFWRFQLAIYAPWNSKNIPNNGKSIFSQQNRFLKISDKKLEKKSGCAPNLSWDLNWVAKTAIFFMRKGLRSSCESAWEKNVGKMLTHFISQNQMIKTTKKENVETSYEKHRTRSEKYRKHDFVVFPTVEIFLAPPRWGWRWTLSAVSSWCSSELWGWNETLEQSPRLRVGAIHTVWQSTSTDSGTVGAISVLSLSQKRSNAISC